MAKCRYCRQIIKGASTTISLGSDLDDTENRVRACQNCAATFHSIHRVSRLKQKLISDSQTKMLAKSWEDGKLHFSDVVVPGLGHIMMTVIDDPSASEGTEMDMMSKGAMLEWAADLLESRGYKIEMPVNVEVNNG